MTERIAIFAPDLSGGGAERAMINLAHGIVEHGLSLDLILARAEGPYLSMVDPRVEIVALGVDRMRHAVRPIAEYLRRARPKALIATMTYTNLAALAAARRAGVATPVIVNEQVHLGRWMMDPAAPLKDRVLPALVRVSFGRAAAVVAASAGVAEYLRRLVPRAVPVHVIHNPVVTDELPRMAAEPVTHPWLNDATVPVVLGVGRLAWQKDFPTLLRAFARVTRVRRARLIILGEGPDRARLHALTSELGNHRDVDLHGFVNNPYMFMAHSQLFVLSSRYEGFGNVLAEAMACGAPVVSTDCESGPAEILEGGKYGRLVPVGDVAALADAIESTLGAPPDPESLRRRAAAFTPRAIAEQYLHVVDSVARTRISL